MLSFSLLALADDHAATAASLAIPAAIDAPDLRWAGLIIGLPALSALLCLLCGALKLRSKLPALITIIALLGSFVLTCMLFSQVGEGTPRVVGLFEWMSFSWGTGDRFQSFAAPFALYIDALTLFWMLFVTGLGSLIAIYASEYMESDVGKGYTRFFGGVSIFLAAMATLVMASNLVVLYLGWEGVGLASYLLIGYYYAKPSAVAAAKKAFIMNRIGDLGLALGIGLIWVNYDTVDYATLFRVLEAGPLATQGDWMPSAIPFLLMLGAFGKSAQLPLFTWLPDAMEGPTPVSALIHAATMVTAGVYLIARTYPLFELHPDALATVAWVGGLTAFVAATIGMAQYDMKRVWAYSTISQLGYMFLGLGVGSTFGAGYHVFTHAFFKALLFLTAGAVMHGFAGQIDIRKLSGLRRVPGFKLVSWLALLGCLWLSALPFSAAFFSKDTILTTALGSERSDFQFLGWLGLFTAFLTAYYTFRVWFRAFAGPVQFEAGDDHHDDDHAHDSHATASHAHAKSEFHPHGPRLGIRIPLIVIALGVVAAGWPGYDALFFHGENWVQSMMMHSSAMQGAGEVHGREIFGLSAHRMTSIVGTSACLLGIAIAYWTHLRDRSAADRARAALRGFFLTRWIPATLENRWYVDEIYHALFRLPLWVASHILHFFDKTFVDGFLVDGTGRVPVAVARLFQPLYNGVLQGYAATMAGGFVLIAGWVFWIWLRGNG
ncbi:MAG: NADH-quinone oxidoreductase subunit L [Phycisphaerales bacterium]|nr:NADH-quinone oxidoreductase subunit L [Phycisphaerales bacterium]